MRANFQELQPKFVSERERASFLVRTFGSHFFVAVEDQARIK